MLNRNSPPRRAEIATRVPIWHVAMQHFRTLSAQGPKTTSVPFMLCPVDRVAMRPGGGRSEEHTSELQPLMRNSYAVFCWTIQSTTTFITTILLSLEY